jgi:hypothetical protein
VALVLMQSTPQAERQRPAAQHPRRAEQQRLAAQRPEMSEAPHSLAKHRQRVFRTEHKTPAHHPKPNRNFYKSRP